MGSAAGILACALVAGVIGQDLRPPRAGEPPRPGRRTLRERPSRTAGLPHEVLARAEALCNRARLGLATWQNKNGSFRLGAAENPAPVAVTALACLALMSLGEVPGRTPNGRQVERGIRYLLDQQDKSKRSKTYGYISNGFDRFSKMHGHGFATTALAEALGMLPPEHAALVSHAELREALEAAVARILLSQEAQTGGWSYDPTPLEHEGSVTVCVVQALRAARNAGIQVDASAIAKAVRYIERSHKPDGSFRYMLGVERSSVALTAAAVATLQAAGEHDSRVLERGFAYLVDRPDIWRMSRAAQRRVARTTRRWPFYERLYIAEALFFASDLESFRRWYTALVPDLAATIDETTGRWSSPRYGASYATAMNILVLALPFQYLPIHQR